MKIHHVVGSMDPSAGGPPAVVSRLGAGQVMLAGAAHEVTVTSHGSPGREAEVAASIAGIPNITRVRFVALPAQLTFGALVPRATGAMLREQIRQSDIVHLHGVWDPVVRSASVEARRLGVPYVLTPHGMLDPWSLKQSQLKKKIAMTLAYRSMLTHAGCLHLLNQDESDLIEPLHLKVPRRVIPNGVFMEEIEPLPAAGSFHAKHPELQGQPFILFLSRLHYKKGLDYLAEAFAMIAPKHPTARLVVAGPDGGVKADFENHIAKSGLSNRVHLVGSIYGQDKFAAIVDAACFCLPSRQEGFSMAITEAIACGTPVVISENCHFPEVGEFGAGEVVALESRQVADALDRVLSDPAKARTMGEAGRELARSRYTWPVIAQQAVEMYEAVLAAQPQKGAVQS